MAIIDTFKLDKNDGSMTGEINTLRISARARILPNPRCSENSPDLRVHAGKAELGGVWKRKRAKDGADYLSVALDDPSFPAPIYAALFERND